VFQPLHDGKASGPFVIFADGFAGAVKEPGRAAHRPTGLAVAPDGSMYISDDRRGRIWHVTFRGAGIVGVEGVASAPSARSASRNASPPEGINPVSGLPTPPGSSPDQVALGGRIFHGQEAGGSCSGCHGSDGKGSTVGSDLTSGKYLWGDGSIAAIMHTIENGVPKAKEHTGAMPPKGGANLTQADVAALADYVWALGHRSGQ